MKKPLIILVLLSLLILPAQAQDDTTETHPLMEMLAFVPATPDLIDTYIAYADLRAMETARGIETPESWADFLDDDDSIWMPVVGTAMIAAPDFFSRLSQGGEFWPEVVGFDFFDIDRSLYFGQPPAVGTILYGDFDKEAINTAFLNRDFEVAREEDNITLWCWVDGCDQGLMTDLRGRDTSNPFGGHIGRREPLAHVEPGFLLNSASNEIVDFMLNVNTAGTGNALTIPAYKASANYIIGQDALLRQVFFIGLPNLYLSDPAALILDPESLEDMRNELEQFGTLPPYELATFADLAFEDSYQVQIILAYGNEELAQAAHEEISTRLPVSPSMIYEMSFMEFITQRGGTLLESEVILDEDTGKHLVVIAFEAPIPTNEPDEEMRMIRSSGLLFNGMIQLFYRRDLMWLQGEILLPAADE